MDSFLVCACVYACTHVHFSVHLRYAWTLGLLRNTPWNLNSLHLILQVDSQKCVQFILFQLLVFGVWAAILSDSHEWVQNKGKMHTLKMLKRTSCTWKKPYSQSLDSIMIVLPCAVLQGARENTPTSQICYFLSTPNYFISPLLQLSYLPKLSHSQFITPVIINQKLRFRQITVSAFHKFYHGTLFHSLSPVYCSHLVHSSLSRPINLVLVHPKYMPVFVLFFP